MSQVKYTGHGANTGGLQGHSVGDDYPYIVRGIGEPMKWQALNSATGAVGKKRDTYRFAWYDLQLLKLQEDTNKQAAQSVAFGKGFGAYVRNTKQPNPYEPHTDEYGKFGAGFYAACRLNSLLESSEQDYTNAYA